MRRKIRIDTDEFCLYTQTHTADDTAGHFGISLPSVYQMSKRLGASVKRRRTKRTYDRTDIADFARSHSIKETAERFKVRASSVRYWCKKYGVEPLRINKDLGELHTETFWEEHRGMTTKQVAELVGTSVSAVSRARRGFKEKLKLPDFRRCGGIRAEKREMIIFLAGRYTYSSIAEVFGVSREYIRQIVAAKKEKPQ